MAMTVPRGIVLFPRTHAPGRHPAVLGTAAAAWTNFTQLPLPTTRPTKASAFPATYVRPRPSSVCAPKQPDRAQVRRAAPTMLILGIGRFPRSPVEQHHISSAAASDQLLERLFPVPRRPQLALFQVEPPAMKLQLPGLH